MTTQDATTLTDQVTNTLLNAATTGFVNEIEELRLQLEATKQSLQHARAFDTHLQAVVWRIFDRALDHAVPETYDYSAALDRLVQLVEQDSDHEIWNPKREFRVTLRYLVTVTGYIDAPSEDDAKEMVLADQPEIVTQYDGALGLLDMNVEHESTELDEL